MQILHFGNGQLGRRSYVGLQLVVKNIVLVLLGTTLLFLGKRIATYVICHKEVNFDVTTCEVNEEQSTSIVSLCIMSLAWGLLHKKYIYWNRSVEIYNDLICDGSLMIMLHNVI